MPSPVDPRPIVIHADDINIVRVGSKEDSGYKTVLGHLQVMAESAGVMVPSRWEIKSRVGANTFSGLPQTGTNNPCSIVQIRALHLHLARVTDEIITWQAYWHKDGILLAENQRKGLQPLSADDYQSP